MEEKDQEKLGEALLKVALGFQVAEVTEEYAEVDGELKLTKRKRTKKDVPPDLKAVQLLLTENSSAVSSMSDEELETEKKRLLAELASAKGAGQVCDEKEKTVKKPRPKPRKRVVRKK
ncbi:MAG: hypothetical protein IJX91_01180 [Clostridia bacterium]|nr:hypothetical protein [Clostridia bacterium]